MAAVPRSKKRRANLGSPTGSHYSAGSSATAANRSLHSVNEIIGGKVREVFVIDDDDSPPPSRPLASELRTSSNYTYTNGHSAYSNGQGAAGPSTLPFTASSGYATRSAAAKGKRKATIPETNGIPFEEPNLQGAAPTKRRKRDPVPDIPPTAAAKRQQLPRHHQTSVASSSRAGPTVRTSAYAGSYDPNQNGSMYGASASLRESFASSAGLLPPPPPADLPCDDKEGHFIVREGDYVGPRYRIISQLGQGTFGKVVECYDRDDKSYVAIKIIRAIQKYRDASQIEIRVLRALRDNDPTNDNKCIHLLHTFNYRNHVCIVSELLGKSVFDFLKENEFQPFPPHHIWSFARQLMKSVAFLHRLNLVHTDLKPENILLVDSQHTIVSSARRGASTARRRRILTNTEIRLIDFGSATFNEEYHSAVVSTRHYRAPEIILNMGWSFPCDVWSIGCILVEFYTGDALYQTHDNLEHLAMMEAVLGPMPDDFRRSAETYKPDLFRGGKLDFPNSETPKNSRRYVRGMKKLQDIVSGPAAYSKHNQRFLHLLRRLLDFDPEKRIKVEDALSHPYFSLDPTEIPP